MEKIEVGGRWPGALPSYDCPVFDYTPTGPVLTIYMDRPTTKEVEDARTGKMSFGYYVRGCVLFLVFKLGRTWMDAPFSIRKHDGRGVNFDWSDEISKEEGLALQLFLVDRGTSLVKAIRLIGTSNSFAVGLRKEIFTQLESPYTDAMYNDVIDDVYRNLSSEDIANRAENIFTLK